MVARREFSGEWPFDARLHQTKRQKIKTGRIHLTDYRVSKGEAQEDQVTAAIEKVTAQVPSTAFLGFALASMGVSLGLHFSGRKHEALFVGQWAAPFLLLGIYNKLVKQHGSDAFDESYGGQRAA
jgi:hypothetical protein